MFVKCFSVDLRGKFFISLYLPRPLHEKSFTAGANDFHEMLLCSISSVTEACHRDACLHVHGFPLAS